MKKIENFLFLPILVLLFFGASKYSNASLDIEIADTYYVISAATVAGCLAVWLLLVVYCFKQIRKRHKMVNTKLAAGYIILTLLFAIVFIVLGLWNGASSKAGYTEADLDALIVRNQLRTVALWCFAAVQLIFLGYFIAQLIKKPVVTDYKPS